VAQASAATLAEMNPLVRVEAVEAPAEAAAGGAAALPPAFFAGYRVVVLAGAPAAVAAAVGDACRAAGGVAFFAAAVGAEHGHFFADLGTHTYVPAVRGVPRCRCREAARRRSACAASPPFSRTREKGASEEPSMIRARAGG
jgi:molybdopterin/thiamine biosynthesis adenylyltransferase